MTTNPDTWVMYEGMDCGHCARPLYLEDHGASVTIWCMSCGAERSVQLTNCRGRSCGARLFFGGKSGSVPIHVRTGSNHFLDCRDSKRFRKSE